MQRWKARTLILILAAALGACSSTPREDADHAHRRLESPDVCFKRCNDAYASCRPASRDYGSCAREVTRGRHANCADIKDPAQRSICLAQALDCTAGEVGDRCLVERDQCNASCGN